ncbi:MAG: glycosyltransferase [Planctomycetota bacterium]
MRVLQVLEAVEGGTRTHLDHLLRGLRGTCDQAFVYALARDPGYAAQVAEYRDLGITCREIPMVRQVAPWRDQRAVRALRRFIGEWKPDIIHAHSSKAGFVTRRAARGTGARVVYTPHCLYFPQRTGLARRLFRWGERINEPATDLYIAVSDHERDVLIAEVTTPGKVARIDNGVVLPDAPAGPVGRRVLFPARAVRQKGWEYFVETARIVLPAVPDAAFIFAGDGPELEDLRRTVAGAGLTGRITAPGHVADMAAAYRAAAVVAVTSRWEGQPYAVLEAMAHGLPVAGFDIPGLNELVSHGGNGLLAPAFDCAALAGHIVHLLLDPAAARRLGAEGRTQARERHALDRFITGLQGLYGDLLRTDRHKHKNH